MDKISKQIIIIRKDLNMRKGKMVAQGAHASMKALLDVFEYGDKSMRLNYEDLEDVRDWLDGRFTKICVSVNSEEELVNIYEQAKAKGLICSLITDAGLTEFNNVPTKTCAAIGPCWSDEVDEITGKLPLL